MTTQSLQVPIHDGSINIDNPTIDIPSLRIHAPNRSAARRCRRIVLRELGPLPDEFGLERLEFERLNEGEFLVDGALPLHELEDLAGLAWKDEDVTTIGGYVVRQVGHLPSKGEELRLDGYTITILAKAWFHQLWRAYRTNRGDAHRVG